MERTAVESKDIAIVGYDKQKSLLEIVFRQGGVYHYSGVPADVHESLMKASSIGTYFNRNIKEAYKYTKIK